MACGVGPKNFNLPQMVPISSLNKNLNRVLMSCKQEYDVAAPPKKEPVNVNPTNNIQLPPEAAIQQGSTCADRCNKLPMCVGYATHKDNGSNCWMKSGFGASSPNTNGRPSLLSGRNCLSRDMAR